MLPGPLTIILNKLNSNLSSLVTPNLNTVGIRIPNHNFILNVIEEINRPVITTSINILEESDELLIFLPKNTHINAYNKNQYDKTIISYKDDLKLVPYRLRGKRIIWQQSLAEIYTKLSNDNLPIMDYLYILIIFFTYSIAQFFELQIASYSSALTLVSQKQVSRK